MYQRDEPANARPAMTSTYYATLLYCTPLCTDAFAPVRKRVNTNRLSVNATEHQTFFRRKEARTNSIKRDVRSNMRFDPPFGSHLVP